MATIRVRPEDYKDVGEELSDGSSLELSPYDMPRLIETYYNRPENTLEIYFTYANEENAVRETLYSPPEAISIIVTKGKHSGKILGLSLQIPPSDLNRLSHIIEPALEKARHENKKFNERANYAVIASILERQQNNIIAGI